MFDPGWLFSSFPSLSELLSLCVPRGVFSNYSMNPTAASWNMANLSSVPGQVNRNHIQNQVSAPKIPKVSLWLIQCFPAKLVAS